MRTQSYTDLFVRSALYFALIVASVATLGSLYFSEINGYVPCALCWYQRILMYPLVGIIAVGLLRIDANLPYYILPFTLFGQGMATYHYLLQKTMLVGTPTVCRAGVSCVTAYINWLGFITIPFLAMTAFFLITIFSLIALTSGEPSLENRKSPPWAQVLGILVVIGGIFYYLFQTGAPSTASLALSQLPSGDFTPVTTPLPTDADAQEDGADAVGAEFLAGADLEQGAQHYQTACAACHGPDGQGAVGLGNNLLTATSVQRQDPRETVALIRAGILANDPSNQTGVAMPPSGGRPDLSDADMLAIIAYLRYLPTAQE